MPDLVSPRLTRRKFFAALAVGAAGAGAVSVGIGDRTAEAQSEPRTVYFFDPEWGAGDPMCTVPHEGARSCHGCVACHLHAANKYYTSMQLADDSRAHDGCKCLIDSKLISGAEAFMMFGPEDGPLSRDEFDPRRDDPFAIFRSFVPFAARF